MARTSQIRKLRAQRNTISNIYQSLSTQRSATLGKYPGLGLSTRHDPESYWRLQHDVCQYPIGAHPSCTGAFTDLLYVREVAMMSIMEQLTDKEDWNSKVFDDDIVAKWRKEALAIPDTELEKLVTDDDRTRFNMSGIISEQSFDYCIEELQHKAKYFERSGIIPTLDAHASVAKSDKLVSSELHEALRSAFQRLKTDQAASPDWHPNSLNMVQDLVHPSMYPLVYGRSRGYQDEVVGVEDAVEKWAGKGTVIENIPTDEDANRHFGTGRVGDFMSPDFWSDKYQWLPANVAFQDDGSVKFTSYINNLHPNKYQDVYQALEKLVETSLPMWDQCLVMAIGHDGKDGAGRLGPRLDRRYDPSDSNADNWTPSLEECEDVEIDIEEFENEYGCDMEDEQDRADNAEYLKQFKWEQARRPVVPEPLSKEFVVGYQPQEGRRLIERFRESGLQIIVKIASIELTPEKPSFPAGGWHVEGMMNEHICATSLYYLDSENVTSSNLAFRMQTNSYMQDEGDYSVGQDEYHWMEHVYGANFGAGNGSACLQNYGSVETKQGRLLAFPNVFHHRVSGFKLADPSKPGHRRFIALWLVDPTLRIVSTANVPPQQMSWWAQSAFGSSPEEQEAAFTKLPAEIVTLLKEKGHAQGAITSDGKLPQELAAMVREYFDSDGGPLPMGVDEANMHRLKLMDERSGFVRTAQGNWERHSYSFCEH